MKKKIKRDKKFRLIPSDKIIDRIKWDSKFDIKDLTIGYLDRFLGLQTINMQGFEETEIPSQNFI
jgi:hypothetical protein